MPTDKCSHEQNREKVCAPCGKNISFGKNTKERFGINETYESLIKKYLNEDFTLNDSKFPVSICTTCRLTLCDQEKQIFKRPLQIMPRYKEMTLPASTRANENFCNCYICLTGRSTVKYTPKIGKGYKRNLNNHIDLSNGLHGKSNISTLPKNEKIIKDSPTITLCKTCIQEVAKGKSHDCTDTTRTHDSVKTR